MYKVLIIQETITEYRVPIFNLLAKHVDLTVAFSKGEVLSKTEFNTLKLSLYKIPKIGRYYKENIKKIANDYDVIIGPLDTSLKSIYRLANSNEKYKFIYWGIGVSAGYNARFDENKKNDANFIDAINKADATIFYSDYPIEKYGQLGIDINKLFVANNTVHVLQSKFEVHERSSLLFIGTLYKQKRIDLLLDNYKRAYSINSNIPNLIIIGDGDERTNIEKWIIDAGLKHKIKMVGAVYEENKLKDYFNKAIVCISPDQAGLSVLKSMGYGVPFITSRNAITGGEIFNIHNGKDGIIINNYDDICNIIIDISENLQKYLSMGFEAQKYYNCFRKPSDMVEGFLNAINYVMKN